MADTTYTFSPQFNLFIYITDLHFVALCRQSARGRLTKNIRMRLHQENSVYNVHVRTARVDVI